MLVDSVPFLSILVLGYADQKFNTDGIVNMVKRDLNWNSGNQNIQSNVNVNRNIRINYLRPSPQNDKIDEKVDYMAFTLYSKSSDTGTFYFVKTATAESYAKVVTCDRQTRHALAFYHFFKKCPEDQPGLIASGYCYRGTYTPPTLVYNSNTFNQGKSMPYLNSEYYKVGDSRVVDPYEQGLIQYCYNKWKNDGFPLTSWTCSVSSANGRRKRAALGSCPGCTCDSIVTSGAPNHSGIPWYTLIMTFLLCQNWSHDICKLL